MASWSGEQLRVTVPSKNSNVWAHEISTLMGYCATFSWLIFLPNALIDRYTFPPTASTWIVIFKVIIVTTTCIWVTWNISPKIHHLLQVSTLILQFLVSNWDFQNILNFKVRLQSDYVQKGENCCSKEGIIFLIQPKDQQMKWFFLPHPLPLPLISCTSTLYRPLSLPKFSEFVSWFHVDCNSFYTIEETILWVKRIYFSTWIW